MPHSRALVNIKEVRSHWGSAPKIEESSKEEKRAVEVAQAEKGYVAIFVHGRVVSQTDAASVPKFLMSVGESNGLDPYLDGSKLANPSRSDCCIFWLIHSRLPADAKDPTSVSIKRFAFSNLPKFMLKLYIKL